MKHPLALRLHAAPVPLSAPCLTLCGLLLLGIAAPASASQAEADEHPHWVQSGNMLQWGIPLGGLLLSFVLDARDTLATPAAYGATDAGIDGDLGAAGLNWPGPRLGGSPQHDFLVSFVRMEVLTYALKYGINARRPNGGGQSFPSGHTSASFMGAEFIRKHYGNGWGAPSYLAASWVGYTRVQSHNHYWRDVIAGAALGIATNYDFDGVETPLGTLHFGLTALLPGQFADAIGDPISDAVDGAAPDRAPPHLQQAMPGLSLELRF